MLIQIPTFNGLNPRSNSETLPPTAAQVAIDCNFTSGALTGLRDSEELPLGTITDNQAIKSGFIIGIDTSTDVAWQAYAWPYDTNAIRSPVQNDPHHRFYWTGRKPDGTKEFKFALPVKENDEFITSTYGEPTPSYRVGAINSDGTNYTLASLYATMGVRGIGLSLNARQITSQAVRFYSAGADGSISAGSELVIGRDCYFSADTSYAQVDGNDLHWKLQLISGGLAAVSQRTIGSTVYKSFKAHLNIAGSGWAENGVIGRVWYTGDDKSNVQYVTVTSGITTYPTLSITTTTPATLNQDAQTTTTQTLQTNGSLVKVVISPLDGSATFAKDLHFGNTPFKMSLLSGADVPGELVSAAEAISSTSDVSQLVIDWTLNSVDPSDPSKSISHRGVYCENESLSTPMQIGSTTVFVVISRVSDTEYTVEIQAGSDQPLETRAYIVTVVNQLGEESAPCDATEVTLNPGREAASLTIRASDFVNDGHLTTLSEGRYPLHGLRVYRTATTSTGDAEYLYAFTVRFSGAEPLGGDVYLTPTITADGVGNQTWYYTDTVETAALGAACPTLKNVRDLNDLQNLQGLIAINNGMTAAFKDNEVWISDPYKPWCYRSDGIHTIPDKVVSLVALEAGFVALTNRNPYYFSGQVPEQFASQRIPGEFPCINKNAAVAIGGAVAYVSPDGPVTINGMQAILDSKTWSREEWRDAYGDRVEAIALANYGHRLIAYFPGEADGYVFDNDDGNWTRMTTQMNAVMRVPSNAFTYSFDQLAFATDDSTDPHWFIFASLTTTKAFVWHSKTFRLPFPTNLGVIQIFGTGTATVDVFVDSVLKYTTPLLTLDAEGTIARLPSGFRSTKWSFRINGSANSTVTGFNAATSISELQNV